MQAHDARVGSISEQLRRFHSCREPYRIYHGTTSTTRKTKLSRSNIIDTSGMNHVLSIESEKRLIAVEPNVSMEQLVDACLARGLLPPVVMEFPAITVGGGFAGTAGESSSFRHGLFDRTIVRVEIVLADGEVVQASENERQDLFNAAAGSFGTFGVITMLEVRLIEAKPYVELTYSHVGGMENAVQAMEDFTATPETEYLEGIMFTLNKGVIITGKLTHSTHEDLEVLRYTGREDPWFYLRAEDITNNKVDTFKELVPVKDYLFRYDRGAFWAGKYSFQYFMMPFTSITRWVLDGFMRTKVMYHALHKSHIADQYIVQDIGFPYATVGQFVEYVHRAFGFYPLWLCPLRMDKEMSLRPRNMAAFASNARSPGMMINVGLWGPGPERYDEFVYANREIERKTAELGGLKCFYAQAFYTPAEFWSLYDKQWYDSLRHRYKAAALPSVYEKVNAALISWKPKSEQNWQEWTYQRFKEQWPVRGVYGALQVLLKSEYLLTR